MNRTSLRGRRTAGFSMMELMIVVVIMGIIASIAMPAMGGMVSRQRLDSATRQLTQDVGYARMLAVRSGEPTRVEITAGGYQIFRGTATTPLRSVNLAQEYPGVSASTGTVRFNTRGMLQPGAAVDLSLQHGPRTRQMQVFPTGRVYHAK
jgi:type IV fimbrial biogenesis protein FimT